ncbi:NAD-dependent succinate-semialdehyde dehydrogenase [Acinetobacter venetianus]|nr:NAD-dependent succinate-semialdehyde dehydrogenase [Acinetobacter venetianus]MCU4473794.1 NAD-dependent succinate-semialdehyde dehydrogenase [Acinetobacter bereziniae]
MIDNQWVDSTDGRCLDVYNPATAEVIGNVAHAGYQDLDRALDAAQKGFDVWRHTPANERAKIMRSAASLLRERVDYIAALLTQEQGKPVVEARGEILSAANIIEWFADEGCRIYGRIVPSHNLSVQQHVLKEAVGPVAAFTPWNFPVNQVVRKLSAALATGCSIIVKAPEETPASPAELIRTFVDAGIPAGVIGLVFGDPAEISSYLIPHPIIRKITFTGSTAVGKQLAALAGTHMKRVTMELGGHAPVIVAEDVDVKQAAKVAAKAKFSNAGQVCISPTRFLVHESIKEQFVKEFVQYVEGIKVGNGLEADTTLGPLANPRRLDAMKEIVDNAISSGAKLVAGGEQIGNKGYFFAPTVLVDVPTTASIFNEEPFGPIAAIQGFSDINDAVVEANRLPYGLAAYAFTNALKTIHLLSHEVETGMLWINQPAMPWPELPFGGIKDSGYGSEGGFEALDAYLTTKTVSILV